MEQASLPQYTNESPANVPSANGSPESGGEEPTRTKVYKSYWGILSETLLTWIIAVAAARDSKWFSVKVYSDTGFWRSSRSYKFGLGKCYSYGDVDSEDVDDACGLTKGARAFQILAVLVISAVLVVVLRAAISPAPQSGKFGLQAGLLLAVFSVFELIAVALAASYASTVGGSYDDDSSDYFMLGATFYVAVFAWLLGTAGSIASLVLRKSATEGQDGPLADLETFKPFVDFMNTVRNAQQGNSST